MVLLHNMKTSYGYLRLNVACKRTVLNLFIESLFKQAQS